MRDEELFSVEVLRDGELKNHCLLEHAHCISALTLSSAQVSGHWIQSVRETVGKRTQKQDAKTETTLQVSRLTLNGTCVRVTHQGT